MTQPARGGMPAAVAKEAQAFWSGATEGRLLVERCTSCGADSFPPTGMCRICRSRSMRTVEVTGPGRIYSYTVNYQQWLPGLESPYVIAVVDFPDHPGVRVVGRLRGVTPEEVTIGTEVDVGFEPGPDGLVLPSFAPAGGSPLPRMA